MHAPSRTTAFPPSSLRRATGVVAWTLALAAPGCGGCEGSEGGASRLPPRGIGPAEPAMPLGQTPVDRPSAVDPDRPHLAPGAGSGARADAPGARDLPNELSRALGTPTECFPPDWVTSHPGTLRVTVAVRFSRDGEASSAHVTAPDAPESLRRCLESRAAAIRLPAPIPEAPRRVETTVAYELAVDRVGEPEDTTSGAGSPATTAVPGMGGPTTSPTPDLRRQLEAATPRAPGDVAPVPPSAYQLPPGFGEDG